MKFFSRPLKSYPAALKWGLIALAVVGTARFLARPVFGIPWEVGNTLTSMTWVMALCIVIYSGWFAWTRGRFGDVLATAALFPVMYFLLLVVFLPLSALLSLDNYYLDPNHFRGPVARHLANHAPATLFLFVFGTILGSVSFGLVWLGRKLFSK